MSINAQLLSTPKLFKRENDIIQWGIDRNIIGDNAQGTVEGQLEKTRQEHQEWQDYHSMDDIGDQFVTLVMACALKEITVSESVQEWCTELGTNYKNYPSESLEVWLDYFLKEYVDEVLCNDPYFFDLDTYKVINSLHNICTYNNWTLDECIEVVWNDIKDRKGMMVHGTFVKQKNLDILFENNIEVKQEDGKVWLEGVLEEINCTVVCETLEELGFKYEYDHSVIKTTGVNDYEH